MVIYIFVVVVVIVVVDAAVVVFLWYHGIMNHKKTTAQSFSVSYKQPGIIIWFQILLCNKTAFLKYFWNQTHSREHRSLWLKLSTSKKLKNLR